MSDSKTIALRTHKLTIGYKTSLGSALFNDLNLTLTSGELVCFMGSNGIGKTTLIKTLAGLQKPVSGAVEITNQHSVSVVLTNRITSTLMTVKELVSYGRYPYLNWHVSLSDTDYSFIEKAIEQVRIGHLVDKKLHELSDGQLQMVMIAKALAQNTPILLLDEPTAHLDLNNRVEIMNILRNLSRTENKTILIATHELDLALQTADRIWLATSDKKIIEGIPEDLVLNGMFDAVFQFKGFDLKTGKVTHEPHRGIEIQLEGNGYEYLWTKNALERSGYEVNPSAAIVISIHQRDKKITWSLSQQSILTEFSSLEEVLTFLKQVC